MAAGRHPELCGCVAEAGQARHLLPTGQAIVPSASQGAGGWGRQEHRHWREHGHKREHGHRREHRYKREHGPPPPLLAAACKATMEVQLVCKGRMDSEGGGKGGEGKARGRSVSHPLLEAAATPEGL